MNQAPLGIAPTTQAGYQQQMAQQNPGGQYYGGALPALGMSANGTQRPMWMAPPAAPQGAQQYSLPESRFIGGVRNYTDGSNLTRISQGDPQWQRMQDAQKMFDARRGGLAQRQQDYQQRTQADMASRRALVENNAYNKSQARKAGLGIGDPLDMAMRGNPDIAGAYGLANIGLQGQQMQNNLGLAALAQQQQQQQHQNMLGMMGHIAGMDLPPAVKQQYMNQIMGGLGLSAPMGGSGLTGTGQQRATAQLTPKQQGEYRALKTPQEREAWLNQNGIMDPVTRGYMLGSGGAGMGIQGYNPGLMQGIFDWITRPFEVAPTRPSRTRVIGLDGKPTTAPLRPLGLGSVPPAAGTPFQSDYMPMY
jgi:hypothetical protein